MGGGGREEAAVLRDGDAMGGDGMGYQTEEHTFGLSGAGITAIEASAMVTTGHTPKSMTVARALHEAFNVTRELNTSE